MTIQKVGQDCGQTLTMLQQDIGDSVSEVSDSAVEALKSGKIIPDVEVSFFKGCNVS